MDTGSRNQSMTLKSPTAAGVDAVPQMGPPTAPAPREASGRSDARYVTTVVADGDRLEPRRSWRRRQTWTSFCFTGTTACSPDHWKSTTPRCLNRPPLLREVG